MTSGAASGSGTSSGATGLDEDVLASSNFARLESGSNEGPSSLGRFLSEPLRQIDNKKVSAEIAYIDTNIEVVGSILKTVLL